MPYTKGSINGSFDRMFYMKFLIRSEKTGTSSGLKFKKYINISIIKSLLTFHITPIMLNRRVKSIPQ